MQFSLRSLLTIMLVVAAFLAGRMPVQWKLEAAIEEAKKQREQAMKAQMIARKTAVEALRSAEISRKIAEEERRRAEEAMSSRSAPNAEPLPQETGAGHIRGEVNEGKVP
jgi:hypothetical protein